MLSRAVTTSRTIYALKSGCTNVERFGLVRNKIVLSQSSRAASSTPFNTVIMFVPQQEAWVVERMGKFSRILNPGLNVLIPIVDKVKYVQSLKEITIDIPKQSAITKDNVNLSIDGVLYLKIIDPYKTSYGIEDPEFAVSQLAQTTMRAELGKMSLEQIFQERESLNVTIVEAINKASEPWGISCLRYEIRDIALPSRITEAMQMQVEAERKKRAAILESEGQREAAINVAEGRKRARILASEADKLEQVNRAEGEAEAVLAIAKARAQGLNSVAESLAKAHGKSAASLVVAEQYVTAFEKLARTNNTLILPSNAGDISNAVGQAMSIYSTITKNQSQTSGEDASSRPFKGSDLEEYFSDPEETEKFDKTPPSSTLR
ncbi:Stomatin-like protein 2, mitochondrial [Frankliniella fusca]|uniref:Stomatin-like protein 2, mitochondrial n=1 Tax=Frankliniella fusca TaxID=407009 RepID=A0AAE1LQV4_9NEOP|nr:Stomatin-like protein 2, mitochondrial [Frankliniella fusca]